MGAAAFCTVTVTGSVTVLGVDIPVGPLAIPVPDTGTGLVDVTIPLPGGLGDLVLLNIPCPTTDAIEIELAGLLDLTISVTEG